MVDRPSSSSVRRAISAATWSTPSRAFVTVNVSRGRASVRETSLIARPIRRSPTSTANTRMIGWSDAPCRDVTDFDRACRYLYLIPSDDAHLDDAVANGLTGR